MVLDAALPMCPPGMRIRTGAKMFTLLDTLWMALRFYGRCVQEAAKGTLDKANAWFWPIGIPIVAFAGWYRGIGQLYVPDTPVGFITFMFVTVAVTWVVFFTLRFIWAPVFIYRQEQRHRQLLQMQLDAMQVPNPDWPIADLFHHIQPDLLERPNEHAWNQIGNDIRDTFSIGRLRVWGRVVDEGIGKLIGERQVLRLIEPEYWHSAHFTYMFFDETAGSAAHTYLEVNATQPVYTDLRVNRTEASMIWPERG